MTARPETVRVFIALDLPQPAKDALRQTVEQLLPGLPNGIRWVDPAGIHLTLKFLGDVDKALVEPLLEAMGQAAAKFPQSPIFLRLANLGVFPNFREPRVLWAGVDGELDALRDLQQLVDESISSLGFSRESRPFRPHLTLGRVRDQVPAQERNQIGRVFQTSSIVPTDGWRSREIHLIRSTLTPQGAIYDSIGSKPIGTEE